MAKYILVATGLRPIGPDWVLDLGRVGNFLGELDRGGYFLD